MKVNAGVGKNFVTKMRAFLGLENVPHDLRRQGALSERIG
jgi:hypothetical protein